MDHPYETFTLGSVIDCINPAEGDEYLKTAARSHLLVLETILGTLTGKGTPWSPHLRGIVRAIDKTIYDIDVANNASVIDEATDELVDAALEEREEVMLLLDQARIAALSMAAHLNAAITRIPSMKGDK